MVPGEVRVNRWLDNGSLLLQSIGQVSNVALEDRRTVSFEWYAQFVCQRCWETSSKGSSKQYKHQFRQRSVAHHDSDNRAYHDFKSGIKETFAVQPPPSTMLLLYFVYREESNTWTGH